MTDELSNALIFLVITGFVICAYGIRVLVKGKAHFDRIEQEGGSPLLSKSIMEFGYWLFQPLARLLVFCHISANQVSWASLFFGALAGCSLAFGHFGSGAAFTCVSSIMDSLDGLVARLTERSSDAGEVLDAAVDRYVEFFFLAGLIVYYREIPALMILTLLALLGSYMVSYSTAKAEALHVTPPRGSMRRPERAVYLILGAALSPITIPWWESSRDYPIAIGHPMVVTLCLVAVIANFSAVERLWSIAKMIREKEKNGRTSGDSRAEVRVDHGEHDSALRDFLN